jgi:hypothetical protein
MSSPYDRLLSEFELEELGEMVRRILGPHSLACESSKMLAYNLLRLLRHIQAVEEITVVMNIRDAAS